MRLSYKKLWKLLIDHDLKKKDLPALAGISSASVTKLAKNENVNTEILEKICRALNCDISDIAEMADLPGCMDEQFAKQTTKPENITEVFTVRSKDPQKNQWKIYGNHRDFTQVSALKAWSNMDLQT